MAKFQIIRELLKQKEVMAEEETYAEAVLKEEQIRKENKEKWAFFYIHKVY